MIPGPAPIAGKMFGFGHMGNIDMHDMISVIAAIERTMMRCGMEIEPGMGLGVLQKDLMK